MGASFKARILTAAIGVPILILVLLLPTPVITGVVMAVSCIGLFEYYKATDLLKKRNICLMGYAAALIIPFCGYMGSFSLVVIFIYILAVFVLMMMSNGRVNIRHVALLLFGVIYVCWFMSHLVYVRMLEYGNFYIWLVIIGAFLTDTCAYFVGCRFGRNKLCPKISPKKTVEGAIGGIVGCGVSFMVYGLVVNLLFGQYLDGMKFSIGWLFVLGLICSVVSQIGDLTASSIKRQVDIKDFGNLLPGHGGILDRCDSIILVAPTVYLFVSNVNILV